MYPSFGIEFTCPSMEWKDVIKGPSRDAVLAHTYKILHYKSLFYAVEAFRSSEEHPSSDGVIARSWQPEDRKEAA